MNEQQNWANGLMYFYNHLQPPPLPNNIEWLHPQQRPGVQDAMQRFFKKYFDDNNERLVLMGINPGRFGAGVTGINFTASKQLTYNCGIEHSFPMQSELSAEYIYEVIEACGGPHPFYQKIFIGSVCPLGFVQEGKNINYYDDKVLLQTVTPFMVQSINDLLRLNVNRLRCVCIGGDKNFKHLSFLNAVHRWFDEITALPHPRFVQQYRRKQKREYIDLYVKTLFPKKAV